MSQGVFGAKLARLMLPVAAAVVAVFLTGQRAQSERTHRVAQEAAEVWRLVDEGVAHAEGRTTATAAERHTWANVASAFDGAVASQVRLPFSREVARLATRTGVGEFRLTEIERDDDGMSGIEDVPPESLDQTSYDDVAFDDVAAEPFQLEVTHVEKHIYTVGFVASFDGAVRFVEGLARISRLVEVESMSVERQLPGLVVEMRLATYGRAS